MHVAPARRGTCRLTGLLLVAWLTAACGAGAADQGAPTGTDVPAANRELCQAANRLADLRHVQNPTTAEEAHDLITNKYLPAFRALSQAAGEPWARTVDRAAAFAASATDPAGTVPAAPAGNAPTGEELMEHLERSCPLTPDATSALSRLFAGR